MAIAGIQIFDDGNVLRIVYQNATELHVHKAQIRTIDMIQNDTVRIDIGEGALHHIYLKWSEVIEPRTTDTLALQIAIKNMLFQTIKLNGGGVGGDATAANQQIQNDLLNSITNALYELKSTMQNTNIYDNPLRIDESVPNVIYYGYAYPGTKPETAEWAIKRVTRTADLFVYEWAGGNRVFINAWDNRYSLSYQKL
jgi:hypothetical protein